MDSNQPDVVLRPGGGRRCRVLFSYTPQNEDELELQEDDEIDFIAEVEDGWWRGKLRNKIGVFPSNFVCEIPAADEFCTSEGETSAPLSSPDSASNLDAPLLPPKPVKEMCRALFAYDAANDDELTLKKDDVITIITKEIEDKGWWKGELRGKIGLFPDNFVEVITPLPDEIPVQKKPDRPAKNIDKNDWKASLIPYVTIQKKMQDANHKEQEEKVAGTKSDGPYNKKNAQNSEKTGKFDGSGNISNWNMFQMKPDTVTSHRKSLELKGNEGQSPPIAGKKPLLPPPLTNKPKPAAGKPNQAKRLSGEIGDLVENLNSKRLSGDAQDFIDGGLASKMAAGSNRSAMGGVNDDLDLDSVERSDMLTHITASRPKAPGRRPPSKELRENDIHSYLTNGNLDTCDKEKNQKEWEKHKPPWVDELKSNLKSNKTSNSDTKSEKKSPLAGGGAKPTLKSPTTNLPFSTGQTAADSLKGANLSGRPANQQSLGQKTASESMSKVSELSIRFCASEKVKSAPATGLSKLVENSKHTNSLVDPADEDSGHISKKEFTNLQSKVDYLEELIMDLVGKLREEVEKRKILEKELNKLTNLVTQV